MNDQIKLVLTGGLTVLAGAHMDPNPGRVTVIAIGLLILTVALYRALLSLAAQQVVLHTIERVLVREPQRGGLGPQNRSEDDE